MRCRVERKTRHAILGGRGIVSGFCAGIRFGKQGVEVPGGDARSNVLYGIWGVIGSTRKHVGVVTSSRHGQKKSHRMIQVY